MRNAQAAPQSVTSIVLRVARPLGVTDVVVYLVDFGQTVLEPMSDGGTHADLPEQEPVVGSMAGRAFVDGVAVVAERSNGTRVWSPIVEGSDRTGVLALTVPGPAESIL